MENDKVFATLQEAMTNLQPVYGDAMTGAIQATELDPPAWFTLMLMDGLSEPIDLEHVLKMNPFNPQSRLQEFVQANLDNGYLESLPDSKHYRLTDAGRKAAARPFKIVHKKLDGFQPMTADKLERLSELLARIVDLTLESDQPSPKPNLTRSRKTDPGSESGPISRIDQNITDLIYYRDDAHNAAWMTHGCSAQGWDVLTAVWRQQSDDIDGLVEQFEARSYTRESIQAAVKEITERGWLSAVDNKLTLTKPGAELRQETEDLTDRYYFGPRSVLTDKERKEFEELLAAYNAAITPEEEPAQTE